jgi:hypothetical protein
LQQLSFIHNHVIHKSSLSHSFTICSGSDVACSAARDQVEAAEVEAWNSNNEVGFIAFRFPPAAETASDKPAVVINGRAADLLGLPRSEAAAQLASGAAPPPMPPLDMLRLLLAELACPAEDDSAPLYFRVIPAATSDNEGGAVGGTAEDTQSSPIKRSRDDDDGVSDFFTAAVEAAEAAAGDSNDDEDGEFDAQAGDGLGSCGGGEISSGGGGRGGKGGEGGGGPGGGGSEPGGRAVRPAWLVRCISRRLYDGQGHLSQVSSSLIPTHPPAHPPTLSLSLSLSSLRSPRSLSPLPSLPHSFARARACGRHLS